MPRSEAGPTAPAPPIWNVELGVRPSARAASSVARNPGLAGSGGGRGVGPRPPNGGGGERRPPPPPPPPRAPPAQPPLALPTDEVPERPDVVAPLLAGEPGGQPEGEVEAGDERARRG